MLRIRLFSGAVLLATMCAPSFADDTPDAEAEPAATEDETPLKEAELAIIQTRVATQYEQVEKLLDKLRAHAEVNNNQRRAELLYQAWDQSNKRRTHALMNKVRDQLANGDLKNALEGQKLTLEDLHALLELLKLEDPAERIKSERQRIKEYIKEVDRLIRLQRSLRGQNENGADADQVAKSQGQVADRAGNLDDKIKKDEGAADGKSDGDSKSDSEGDSKGDSEGDSKGDSEGDSKGDSEGDSKGDSEGDSKGDSEGDSKGDSEGDSKGDSEGDSKGDSEGDSKGDSEGDSKGDSEGDSKGDSEGDSKGDSEGDSKGDSEGDSKGDSQGDSMGDSSGDSKGDSNGGEQSDDNPVRKRIQAAEQKMRDAQRKLEEAKRKESIDDQRKAEDELAQAKKELEEILKQLREEEVERMLAMLEGRFRAMLQRELKVYEATRLMASVQAGLKQGETNSELEINAAKQSLEQAQIARDADTAYNMLLDEGSSIAFPETVLQMSEDMKQVSERLNQTKVGRLTQELEEDIIDTLGYIIEALVKAQQDPDEQPPMDGQPPPPGPPQDQPLVDLIAEMKMIRGLQERINTRHKRYTRFLDDPDDPVGVTNDPDLRVALDRLADRQEKVQQIANDIVLGKNQ